MIHVLHVIGKMDRGGAETLLMNLHREIDTSRIQFNYLVHTQDQGEYDEEIKRMGGQIFHIPAFKGSNIASYKRACYGFFADHPEFQIIHGHIGSCAALYLSSANKLGRYTIAHSHSRHFPLSPSEIAFRLASFPTRFVADYFFGCSLNAGIDRFGKKIANSDRFDILKNGVPLDQLAFDDSCREHIRRELDLDKGSFAIAHVGRLTAVKNHPFLFECFSDILKDEPTSELFLVGAGEEKANLIRLAEDMGLTSKIHFLGLRNDIPAFLMGMDAFVFPSKSEGLPLACVEAQASGLPCFISSGVSEETLYSPRARFLPLSIGPKKWADEVLSGKWQDSSNRLRGIEHARDAGYDIASTASYLTVFYENAVKTR